MIPDCIKQGIEKGSRFCISSHVNPDADGAGGAAALAWLLWKLGKRAYIFNAERLPGRFAFIEGLFPVKNAEDADTGSCDTWIIIDASRFDRTGFPPDPAGRTLINIDHHADNNLFGRCNWVDCQAPAVSELILRLIRSYGFTPALEIAEALYAGILIDTGGFKFSNTNDRAFRAAGELADCGVDCSRLYRKVFMDKSIGRLRLEGILVSRAEMAQDGRVCIMEITDGILRDAGAGPDDLEGISNLPMEIKNIQVGLIFIRRGDKTKICFRSNGGIRVGELASQYGGGGHPAAAGCTVAGPYDRVRRDVLQKVAGLLSEKSMAGRPAA